MFKRKPSADLWRNTLSQIPTVMGRLDYLAGLRDPNTGRYFHQGLVSIYGEAEAENVLRASHEAAFEDWLGLSMERQKADLDLFLSSVEGGRKIAVESWTAVAHYRNIAPANVTEAEYLLFVRDLELLLAVLRAECGVPVRDPDA